MSLNNFTFAEINLKNLKENIRVIRQIIGNKVKLTCVVKDNAYGHGAVRISKTLKSCGIDFLAVNSTFEAIELSSAKIKTSILIMGGISTDEIKTIAEKKYHITLFNLDFAKRLNKIGEKIQKKINCHIKIDTGMNRLGIREKEVKPFLDKISNMKFINPCGIMSHLPDYNNTLATDQINIFKELAIVCQGRELKYVHLASSGSTFYHKEAHFNMVRCGLSMYGYLPSRNNSSELLSPVMSLKTKILIIKKVPINQTISYNRNFIAKRDMRVAVLPIGYADGYYKLYSKFGEVLIDGKRAKIVGDICMDMLMIDVTDFPNVKPLDEVVLIGNQKNESISAYDISEKSGFIPYEILTSIKTEVMRRYVE